MEFECLLKPNLNLKTKREVNLNTSSKLLQKSYWEKYIEICDLSENPDMQIKEALPQHYQNISIQKAEYKFYKQLILNATMLPQKSQLTIIKSYLSNY